MTSADESLRPEIESFLRGWLGSDWTATPIEGDISLRSYTRITTGDDVWVVAHYPEEIRTELAKFTTAAAALKGHAAVPTVAHHDESCIAQTDVGDTALVDVLREDPARGRELYSRAIDELIRFQKAAGAARELNPPFGVTRFLWELEMAGDFYAERLMNEMSRELEAARSSIFRELATSLTRHPYVLCHRDYHGENIHVVDEDLYIIDFQDARMGPDTYDLASLLRDRGVIELLGRDFESEQVRRYAELVGDPEIEQRYWETLLQRAIKTIGSFAMVARKKSRLHYLDWINPALDAVRECLEKLPEYRSLTEVFPMTYDGRRP